MSAVTVAVMAASRARVAFAASEESRPAGSGQRGYLGRPRDVVLIAVAISMPPR